MRSSIPTRLMKIEGELELSFSVWFFSVFGHRFYFEGWDGVVRGAGGR